MKLKVGKKSYQLKYGLRAFILFEKMADKPFEVGGMTDWVLFVYAMLLAGTPEAEITLDEFVDILSMQDIQGVIRWCTKLMAVENQLADAKEEAKKK